MEAWKGQFVLPGPCIIIYVSKQIADQINSTRVATMFWGKCLVLFINLIIKFYIFS